MTCLRFARETSPSRSARSAATVVSRSSQKMTGRPSSAPTASPNLRQAWARGPSEPLRFKGRPTTMRSTSRSRARLFKASRSFLGPTRRTVVTPCAVNPSSSQIATPIVFVPTSRPITRIGGGTIPSRDADAIHQPPVNWACVMTQPIGMRCETLGIVGRISARPHTAPKGRENTMSSVGGAAPGGIDPSVYALKEMAETAIFSAAFGPAGPMVESDSERHREPGAADDARRPGEAGASRASSIRSAPCSRR